MKKIISAICCAALLAPVLYAQRNERPAEPGGSIAARYQFAKDTSAAAMAKKQVVLTSNIREVTKGEKVINFNLLAK